MEQPLTRNDPAAGDAGAHDALSRAAARLELALASLEAGLGRGPPEAAPADAALHDELQAALAREQALQGAAGAASQALGRAMSQVRLALQADEAHEGAPDGDEPDESGPGESGPDGSRPGEGGPSDAGLEQGVLDLALESAPQSPEDEAEDGAAAPGEEPAA